MRLKELEMIVKGELAECMYQDESFGKNAFVGKVASDNDIEKFLLECALYDNDACRWRDIPEQPAHESELYDPMGNVFAAVIGHFYPSSDPNPPTRVVLDSHATQLHHHLDDPEDGHVRKIMPDFMIQGSGPNYPPPPVNSTESTTPFIDYTFCATPLEIKKDKNDVFEDNLAQIAVYARECLAFQGNRLFVYSMIITEKYAQLYHFDRSGGYYSHSVDIHANATDFVRFILGVSSPDDGVIGFDEQIFWEGEQLVLKAINDKGIVQKYDLDNQRLFFRKMIRGRGTSCWIAQPDDGGKLVIVKDSWRLMERFPEWELLKAANGLEGVGQMIAYFPGGRLSDHRGLDVNTIPEDMKSCFQDRAFCRMVLEAYGRPIDHFETADELLYAFRDAISGHQHLWDANILHRDISINNILLGAPGAKEGWRGVLIDLDMGIWLDQPPTKVDCMFGTREFQSVVVLQSVWPTKARLCHDYLDDLESFFYVLVWICFAFSGPRKMVKPFPELLRSWHSDDPLFAGQCKISFYWWPLEESGKVTPFFGDVFQELLENLHGFFDAIIMRKSRVLNDQVPLTELIPDAPGHYATVLGFVDDAIRKRAALQASAVENADRPVGPSTPAPTNLPRTPLQDTHLTNLGKRTSNPVDLEEDTPSKSKKQKK